MPTKNPEYHEAWRFFMGNAGYSYNPDTETEAQGKNRTARMLAKAERNAASKNIRFEWHPDDAGCAGCACGSENCDCFTGAVHETYACVALYGDPSCHDGFGRPAGGAVVASLSAICNPSREYRRVVEAELAVEALEYLSRADVKEAENA